MGLFSGVLQVGNGSCPPKETCGDNCSMFHRPEMPFCHSTNSVKALKGTQSNDINHTNHPLDVILLDPTAKVTDDISFMMPVS